MRRLAICQQVLHISEIARTLHFFCPPAFLKSRLNQYWRSAFFHPSCSSFYNSSCFGSVRSTSSMIPTQLFASKKKCQRTVRVNGSWIFSWVPDFSKTPLWFGFAWITLNPLRRQVLHDHFICAMHPRCLFFIKDLVVCCCHIAKSFANFNSVRPIVRISSARRSRNFRASAYFAIRVFGKKNEWIVLSSFFVWRRFSVDARKEEVLAVVFPRQLERRPWLSPCSSFREWLKPFW